MTMYDLAVIGAGPGGYVAAIMAAQQGLKVILAEKDTIGGTCLNRGCIPTKSFLSDIKILRLAQKSPVLLGSEGLKIDLGKMVERKNEVVKIVVDGVGHLVQSFGIEYHQGQAEILNPQSIRVVGKAGEGKEFRVRNIILATGSKTAIPSYIQVDGHFILTTDEALNPDCVPKTMTVVGGGVIGVEFATIYQSLGTKVTILEILPDVLMGEDEEVRQTLRFLLRQEGVQIHLESEVKDIKIQGEDVIVTFEDKQGNTKTSRTDKLLVATGRVPNMDGLDPERIGLRKEGPFVKVNSWMETNISGIYAIGDLVGGWMLAHAASAEGEVAVENILGKRREWRPERVPRCIWSYPEIASVGLTEQEARDAGFPVKVGKFFYRYSAKAQIVGDMNGFVKIIGDSSTGEIMGVHILGENATELISEPVLAMTMEAAVEDLTHMIKGHPTFSECVREAALAWEGKVIHMPK